MSTKSRGRSCSTGRGRRELPTPAARASTGEARASQVPASAGLAHQTFGDEKLPRDDSAKNTVPGSLVTLTNDPPWRFTSIVTMVVRVGKMNDMAVP